MYMRFSVSAIFLSLITFFAIQILDKLKEVLILTSTVGVEESSINNSFLGTNLVIIPIIFLVLSILFYFLSKSNKQH